MQTTLSERIQEKYKTIRNALVQNEQLVQNERILANLVKDAYRQGVIDAVNDANVERTETK